MESKIEPHLPTYPPHSSGALPTPSHSSELSAIPPPSAPRSMALLGTPPSSSPFHRTPRHSFPPLLDSSPLRGASPCPPSLILAATAEKLRPRSGRGRDAAPASLYCDRRLPRTPLFSIGVAQPRGGRCTEATLKRGFKGSLPAGSAASDPCIAQHGGGATPEQCPLAVPTLTRGVRGVPGFHIPP